MYEGEKRARTHALYKRGENKALWEMKMGKKDTTLSLSLSLSAPIPKHFQQCVSLTHTHTHREREYRQAEKKGMYAEMEFISLCVCKEWE